MGGCLNRDQGLDVAKAFNDSGMLLFWVMLMKRKRDKRREKMGDGL